MMICPNRAAQNATTWAVENIRSFREATRQDLILELDLFKELLGNSNWNIITSGSYYAYVKHPYAGRSSAWVAERLAKQAGVILLPGSFFCNPATVDEDCYLRVCEYPIHLIW